MERVFSVVSETNTVLLNREEYTVLEEKIIMHLAERQWQVIRTM
jgi:hypothetical protein